MKLPEIVCHDGCILRDGFWGGTSDAIYQLWHMVADYNDDISQRMNYQHWLQIKEFKNSATATQQQGKLQDGYNQIYTFDYIWQCLIQSVNFLTNHAKLDLCGYETSWATESCGDPGSGLTGRISNKPVIMKGGQTVLVSDVH